MFIFFKCYFTCNTNRPLYHLHSRSQFMFLSQPLEPGLLQCSTFAPHSLRNCKKAFFFYFLTYRSQTLNTAHSRGFGCLRSAPFCPSSLKSRCRGCSLRGQEPEFRLLSSAGAAEEGGKLRLGRERCRLCAQWAPPSASAGVEAAADLAVKLRCLLYCRAASAGQHGKRGCRGSPLFCTG